MQTLVQSFEPPIENAFAIPSGLEDLHARTLGDPEICIAVLDGPVALSHPCFRGASLTRLPTLINADADNGPASAHGTHVTSIIFGQPGSLIAGVAPRCRGLLLPVFSDTEREGVVVCSQLDLARAIFQAIEHGAHVINISGGQPTRTEEPDEFLGQAIQACIDNNVLIVAAAGNDGCECLHMPAAAHLVLSVGAMDEQGRPLESSNWAQVYRLQGILAPGRNILGAVPDGGVMLKSGTSFAAPLISGLAGLLLSIQRRRGRKPDPRTVRAALLASAIPCDSRQANDCRRYLAGRLNPVRALRLIEEGGTAMSERTLIEPSGMATAVPAEANATAIHDEAASPIAASQTAALLAGAAPLAAQVTASDAALAKPPLGPSPRAGVQPSDCGCGGGAVCTCAKGKPTLVYALGKLGYDFGTEARRDSFAQAMPGQANPHDPAQIVDYLAANPYEAESLIWTLNLDATPIYAIVPSGPFATLTYDRLREAFEGQLRRGVELVSIPGVIAGNVTLMSGQVLPAVVPAVRGIFSWTVPTLVEAVLGKRPQAKKDQEAYDRRAGGLNNFLGRVYYDLRNLGLTPEDRALNYSATNAFQVRAVIEQALQGDFELDRIAVRKSPVCRPDSECYDVELSFFFPPNENVANRVYRFTVDVSDVIPVTIGEIRSWSKRH
jgi:cyanobactin maturation PatA/PatG family protease